MPSTNTFRLPRVRKLWHRGPDGVWERERYQDDSEIDVFDMARELTIATESISSIATEASGVTISASSTSGATFTLVTTGTGTVEVTITTNVGYILVRKYRWVGIDQNPKDFQ